MIKIKVLGKNILAKPMWLTEENKSGLVISSDANKTRKNYGIVKFIGTDVSKVKVEDVVIFQTRDINQLELDDERFFLIIEDDIIAIEEDGKNNNS